jgi:hypothetical protein
MGRKNLNDAIHGDRAIVRGGHVNAPATRSWDDFKASKSDLDDLFGDPSRKPKSPSTSVQVYNGSKGSSKGGKYSFERCYHSHPALKLPGTELVIYGGSCCDPEVKDADVYVGFDGGMRFTQRSWPWKKGTEFLFEIRDMCAPNNPAEFIKLVDWVKKQLEEGKKVHVGCIGGHGRTGTFLSALVSRFGEPDAIKFVRENYCKKAVESSEQVKFLGTHFGVLPVGGSKSGGYSGTKSTGNWESKYSKEGQLPASGPERIVPMHERGSIWDPPVA